MQKCLRNVQTGGSLRDLVSSAIPLPAVLLCAAAVSLPSIADAAIDIAVPNFNFSVEGNEDSESPTVAVFGSYDRIFGTGPWSVQGTGVDLPGVTDIAAPSAAITSGVSGNVTIGGLVAADLGGGLVSMGAASVYQNDIGATFTEGWTYTLTADVTTASLVDLDLLSDSGVGLGLRSAGGGTIYAEDIGSVVDLGVFTDQTTTITYTFTAGLAEAGTAIGIDLYVGHATDLASVTALGAVSFDNVVLTAVPEPGASALLVGLLGVAYVGLRRSKRAR